MVHYLNLPIIAVLGFIGACGTVAYSVSAPALVPALTGDACRGKRSDRTGA
jgi:hypothetical protein